MTTKIRGTLDAAMVGVTVGPITQTIDARWLMAYAAGLGETDPRYFDTLSAGGPIAHPIFPVCYEWPVAVALRNATIPADLQAQSVHATHHLTIHRPLRAGDMLRTTARVIEVAARRSGTEVVSRFETIDARGDPVTTTDYGSVYRDVALVGAPHRDSRADGLWSRPKELPASDGTAGWTEQVEVGGHAAWIYTECARIWNPIHTDIAVAQRAGLSAPILHGTATLALAVSRIVTRELSGDASRVRQIHVRFTGMVLMPSLFNIRVCRPSADRILFDGLAPNGAFILAHGGVYA